MTPAALRAARQDHPGKRERDLARLLGVSEGRLLAADVGREAVVIAADPARLVPELERLGEVLALTRNESAVHEKVGHYREAGPGRIAGPGVDLTLRPEVWRHAFAVERPGENGPRRSVQIFDAAGEAVHKVHLRPASDAAAFVRLRDALRLAEQAETIPEPEPEPEPETVPVPEAAPSWPGAEGEGWPAPDAAGEALAPGAVTLLLHAAAERGLPLDIAVGNHGCLQRHSGPVVRIVPMGPWINVLDPGFDLHLRQDHVAALRLAGGVLLARDAAGGLIARLAPAPGASGWDEVIAGLPRA